MKQGFEEKFTDIQSGLISLCLEGASTEVEKVYAYGYVGDGFTKFNVLFEVDEKICNANEVITDSSLLFQVLALGSKDLEKLRQICSDYDAKCPSEMKMYYDCRTHKYSADIEYDLVDGDPLSRFAAWKDELIAKKTDDKESGKETSMDKIDYLPLGSVVLLKGGTQKLLIVSRGIFINQDGETLFFDYGGILYPDGLVDDRMAYFNHDGIDTVLFEGYNDRENRIFSDNINRYLQANPSVKRGNPGGNAL